MVTKILTGLVKNMEGLGDTLNKEMENQPEMKNSAEIKNTLVGINRLEEAEEWIGDLQNRMESNQAEQERET